jgi:hypothetical protein
MAAHDHKGGTMRHVWLGALALCAATLLVGTGCSDTTEPQPPAVTDGDALFAKPANPGKGKKEPEPTGTCRFVFAAQDWEFVANTSTVSLDLTHTEAGFHRDNAFDGLLTATVTTGSSAAAGTTYTMRYDFDITYNGEPFGWFVARDQVRCRRFPCSINTKMAFVEGDGAFMDGFGGHINNGGELIEHEGYIVYKASIGGELCWQPEPAA